MENIINNTIKKERIEYIDSLRGFTIILVVFSHVSLYLFGTECPTNNVFVLFRMPLFFFISGYMAYNADFSYSLIQKRVKNRLLYQFLPTIACFILYIYIYNRPFVESVLLDSKAGYWFTWVSVWYFAIYIAVVILFKVFKAPRIFMTLTILVIILLSMSARIFLPESIMSSKYFTFFSGQTSLIFMSFFFIGILAHQNQKKFDVLINSRIFTTILFILVLMPFFIPWHFSIFTWVQRICGVFLLYHIFQCYSAIFSSKTKIGSVLSYVGKHTLEIYLFHYFILSSCVGIADCLNTGTWDSMWILQFLVYFAMSIVIVVLSLLVAAVLRTVPYVHLLFFGRIH